MLPSHPRRVRVKRYCGLKRGGIGVVQERQELRPAQPASEFWRRTLMEIPSVFGRMVFIAELRDPATGRYSHPGLGDVLGLEDADRALRHSHHQIFSEWLGFNLADQKADLDQFLAQDDAPYARRYRELIPSAARDVERQLYLTDLEILLDLLRLERGAPNDSRSIAATVTRPIRSITPG